MVLPRATTPASPSGPSSVASPTPSTAHRSMTLRRPLCSSTEEPGGTKPRPLNALGATGSLETRRSACRRHRYHGEGWTRTISLVNRTWSSSCARPRTWSRTEPRQGIIDSQGSTYPISSSWWRSKWGASPYLSPYLRRRGSPNVSLRHGERTGSFVEAEWIWCTTPNSCDSDRAQDSLATIVRHAVLPNTTTSRPSVARGSMTHYLARHRKTRRVRLGPT